MQSQDATVANSDACKTGSRRNMQRCLYATDTRPPLGAPHVSAPRASARFAPQDFIDRVDYIHESVHEKQGNFLLNRQYIILEEPKVSATTEDIVEVINICYMTSSKHQPSPPQYYQAVEEVA